MTVVPSFPAKTIPELSTTPRQIRARSTWPRPANGSSSHLAGELFKMMTGVEIAPCAFQRRRRRDDGVARRTSGGSFAAFPPRSDHQERQVARAGGHSTKRVEALPDVPAVGEFVPGYEASGWNGVGAPKNTPIEIIEKLNKEINASLADPKLKARIDDFGGTVFALSRPSSANSSPRKPKSGARSSARPTSKPRDHSRPLDAGISGFHLTGVGAGLASSADDDDRRVSRPRLR